MTPPARRGRGEGIAPSSREFLVALFAGQHADLAEQPDAEGAATPDSLGAAQIAAIVEGLLRGLSGEGELPDDQETRKYVRELARATDEENEYERVDREHRALRELDEELGRS